VRFAIAPESVPDRDWLGAPLFPEKQRNCSNFQKKNAKLGEIMTENLKIKLTIQ